MKRVALLDDRHIYPFHEPARELRVLNKPLKLHQRDVLLKHCDAMIEHRRLEEIPANDRAEMIVYQDNLFFDQPFIDAFLAAARERACACRVAFRPDDQAIARHAVYLQDGIHREGDLYVANLWYFPHGVEDRARPLVVDTQPVEMGSYHVPTYMANEKGEIVYAVPMRAFLSIEHWYHIFLANTPFGVWSIGARFEDRLHSPWFRLSLLWRAMLERKQVLSTSRLVVVGKNTNINPTARIQGPTSIGDNCYIGPGVVVQNSIIGNNVNLQQGAQVMLSVVSDNCFLPFRAGVFMSTLMERCIVAQNACLQLCVLGRGTFVGAGTVLTDFYLVPKPIQTMRNGKLECAGTTVLGGCVGHNCRIGAGLIVYPGRVIESDTCLVRSDTRSVIVRNVAFEQSDHHAWRDRALHKPLYRPSEQGAQPSNR
ncbi:MAG: multidrug transporter [Anaerolineae bacterium]|nr:multidrug transporter [Anaerolineae bacterium]